MKGILCSLIVAAPRFGGALAVLLHLLRPVADLSANRRWRPSPI
jgi:hypothetical protein